LLKRRGRRFPACWPAQQFFCWSDEDVASSSNEALIRRRHLLDGWRASLRQGLRLHEHWQHRPV